MSEFNTAQDTAQVLVTGANSGLGYAICCRLIDEFLYTRPTSEHLCLIITTRDVKKGEDTAVRLRKHLQSTGKRARSNGARPVERVSVVQEILDLSSLRSVKALASRLQENIPKLDAIILNAGIGGWTGINWPLAIYGVFTDLLHVLTFPNFKLSAVGWTTKPQLPEGKGSEPAIGEVFCANLFGHYMLAHDLTPLLKKSYDSRIIWISSLEAYPWALSMDDFQGIKSPLAYESSKRITDALAITSDLPATAPWTQKFYESDHRQSKANLEHRPRMYVAQPGLCYTSIIPVPYILQFAWIGIFYVCRWLGSMWHNIDAYTAACAPVWLALSPQDLLDDYQERDGLSKWGSATDSGGNERVERTEVDGWGYGGIIGDAKNGMGIRKGRRRGAVSLTEEARTEFVQLGRECWQRMEELRLEWEERLKTAQ